MQWLLDNWIIVLLAGGMIGMHLFGHGGHGGHGGGHGRGKHKPDDADTDDDFSRSRPHAHDDKDMAPGQAAQGAKPAGEPRGSNPEDKIQPSIQAASETKANRRIIANLARPIRTVGLGIVASLMLASNAAVAADTSGYTTVDGMLVYYAVLPAEIVREFPTGSPEAEMHGGVPGGRHVHHIQIAAFDAETSERITDAQVSASIAEIGLGSESIELEPFLVDDVLTYGGYFEFSKLATYAIDIRIERPDAAAATRVRFDYRHH